MIRIALVGCGNHSQREHAASLCRFAAKHRGQVTLAATCDLDLDRAEDCRQKFGFERAYDDVERMLDAEELDGVVAVMPIAQIAPMAGMLLERAMPCVIEKPPGATLDEARALAETARRTGTRHMVSVNRRFHPYINRALTWAKTVGPVRYIRGAMLRSGRDEPDFMWGTGLHAVDAMRHLAGAEVTRFTPVALRADEITGQWHTIAFEFAQGVSGRLDILPTAGRTEEAYELFGENFSTYYASSFWKDNTLVCRLGGTVELEQYAADDEPYEVACGAFAETSAFITALQDATPMRPTLDDVLPSLEICHAVAADAARA